MRHDHINGERINGRSVNLGQLRCEADMMRGQAFAEVVQGLRNRFGRIAEKRDHAA